MQSDKVFKGKLWYIKDVICEPFLSKVKKKSMANKIVEINWNTKTFSVQKKKRNRREKSNRWNK